MNTMEIITKLSKEKKQNDNFDLIFKEIKKGPAFAPLASSSTSSSSSCTSSSSSVPKGK